MIILPNVFWQQQMTNEYVNKPQITIWPNTCRMMNFDASPLVAYFQERHLQSWMASKTLIQNVQQDYHKIACILVKKDGHNREYHNLYSVDFLVTIKNGIILSKLIKHVANDQ